MATTPAHDRPTYPLSDTPPQWTPPPPPPARAPRHGFGITAMVLGIVGAAFGLIPLLFWLAIPLGVLALTFGILARKHGMGKAGAILGVASLGLGIAGAVIVNSATDKLTRDLNSLTQPVATAPLSVPQTIEPQTTEPPPVAAPTTQTIPNSISVTETDPATNAVSTGTVQVISVSVARSASSEFDTVTAKNGYFVTFTVRYTVTGGSLSYNEWDWTVVEAGGARTTIQDGNATMFTVVKDLKTLSANTLTLPGEYEQSTVTFDAASAHGQLVYTPYDNFDPTPLGIWQF